MFLGDVAAHDSEQAIVAICIKTDILFIIDFFNHGDMENPQREQRLIFIVCYMSASIFFSVTPCLLCERCG